MARRGRPPQSWKELYEDPQLQFTDENIAAYEAAYAAMQARPSEPKVRRGPGRPRKPETERDRKLQEACGHVRWLMEMHNEDPWLRAEVEDWLLRMRLTSPSIWEAELPLDDWAKVSGPRPKSSPAFKRKILDKLVQRRLAQDMKLDTALHIAAHLAGLDGPGDFEALEQYRDKGSTTERRHRKHGG